MGKSPFSHPLGLGKTEYEAVLNAHHARSLVPSGHFLAPVGRTKSYERMIERGFLTEADRLQPHNWLVVKMTDENLQAYNAAIAASGTSAICQRGESE